MWNYSVFLVPSEEVCLLLVEVVVSLERDFEFKFKENVQLKFNNK